MSPSPGQSQSLGDALLEHMLGGLRSLFGGG